MNSDSPRHAPWPKTAPEDASTELRKEQLRNTEETIYNQLSKGARMPVKPPPPLIVSGRVLVATFLLPYEATIDLEEGRDWVKIYV